jgi:chromosome segregation ATPase
MILLTALFLSFATDFLVAAPAVEPQLSPNASALKSFFDQGFDRRKVSLKETRKAYYQLQQNTSDGPVVDYAFALVLLHRNQFDEGMKVLDTLRENRAEAYAPAWQTSIWHRFARRQFETGIKQLSEYALMTADTRQRWSASNQPARNARWIGSMLTSLRYQYTTEEMTQQTKQLEDEVQTSFPVRLRLYWEAGTKHVLDQRQELNETLASLDEAHQVEQQKVAEETAKELAERSEKTDETREQLKLTAEEWREKLDKELIEFSRQIGSAQRDYTFLDNKRLSLDRSIELVQKEQTALEFSLQNPPQGQFIDLVTVNRERNRLAFKYNQYQAEYRETVASLQAVTAAGTQLLQARQALINEYQQATGKLVKQDKKLELLSKKLSKSQEELETEGVNDSSTKVRVLKSKMKFFQTYLPLDIEQEAQALVDSLNIE